MKISLACPRKLTYANQRISKHFGSSIEGPILLQLEGKPSVWVFTGTARMGSQNPRPTEANRAAHKRIPVARKLHYLYDSRKASERDPSGNFFAGIRAIILVALLGGAVWYLLWKLLVQFSRIR
jgi:hypothetical protein